MDIATLLPWIQIILSVILVAVILLQQTGSGVGSTFGGQDSISGYHTRRGAERVFFVISIVVAVLFATSAFLALVY